MKKKLKDICTQVRGVSYKPSDLRDENSGLPILRANNIQDTGIVFDELVYVDSSKVHSEQYLLTDDIVICASSGSKNLVGKAASYKSDLSASFGAFCKVVRINNSDDLCKAYIQQYFQSKIYRNAISESSAGANINNIKTEDIEALEIPLPSKEEQQKIAAELDKIQSAIDNKKQQLSLLDEAVKSEFVEMFDRIIEKSEKIDLEKICTFVTVGIANSATHAFCDDGIIMFRNQNIKEDFLDDSDVIYIKQDFAEKYKSKALKENDLLIVRTGYPGICCLVPKKYEGCQTFTTLIARLKKNSDINPKFICHYINSKYGREYVEKNQAGVAQQNFGATALSKMPMVIPPINLQNQFAAFVQQIDKSKFVVKQQIADLQELLDSKMQEYFGA